MTDTDTVAGYYVAFDEDINGDYTATLYSNRADAERELDEGLTDSPEYYQGAKVAELPESLAYAAKGGVVDSTALPQAEGAGTQPRGPEAAIAKVQDICNEVLADPADDKPGSAELAKRIINAIADCNPA